MVTKTPMLHGLVERTNAEYHEGPGISKSRLDLMARGPRLYWAECVDPKRKPRESKPAWTLGSATHSAILEPEKFGAEFVVLPELNLRKPAHRDERDQLTRDAAARGQTVITPEQFDLASNMRDAVYAHPVAGPLLGSMRKAGALAEQSYYAVDPATGMLVKCRFDYLQESGGIALDLKTTRGASEREFSKSVEQYRYDVQEAWYRRVYALATGGVLLEDWIFLAVESAHPHQIGIYRLPRDVVRAAERVALANLRQICDCTMLDHWPDPGYDGVVELPLSGWHRKSLGMDSPENDFPNEE